MEWAVIGINRVNAIVTSKLISELFYVQVHAVVLTKTVKAYMSMLDPWQSSIGVLTFHLNYFRIYSLKTGGLIL